MLWLRGLIFTALVPLVVAVLAPARLDPGARAHVGLWEAGWLPILIGGGLWAMCLLRFLAAGGTPAVFFTRPLRGLIGEEPPTLVSVGPYRFSRNPMYVAVLMIVFGQAILFRSVRIALYGGVVFVVFELVIVFIEEPHLRKTQGASYQNYCAEVRRWVGRRL